jgi:hypothetical protein
MALTQRAAVPREASRLLAIAAGLLAICAVRGVVNLAPYVIEAGRRLLTLDGEGRRRLVYGDCKGRGYGYVRRVTEGIPRDRGRPRVRSGNESYPTDVVLPEDDWNRESRVVIGIGFSDAAFHARLLATDGPGFTVVHRSGGCLTAVSPEILRDGDDDGSRWHAWLAHLRQLP